MKNHYYKKRKRKKGKKCMHVERKLEKKYANAILIFVYKNFTNESTFSLPNSA